MIKEKLPNVKGQVELLTQFDLLVIKARHVVSKEDGWKPGDTVEMKVVAVNGRSVIE